MSFEPLPQSLEQDISQFAKQQHIGHDEAILMLVKIGLEHCNKQSTIKGLPSEPMTVQEAEVADKALEIAMNARRERSTRVGREEIKPRLTSPEVAKERHTILNNFLETEIWPNIPPEMLGKSVPQAEQDSILGYGTHGYCE